MSTTRALYFTPMSDPTTENSGTRLMGLDYGLVRIGVALSDTGCRLASAHRTLAAGKGLLKNLLSIVQEQGVAQVVLGLPMRRDGSPGTLDAEIRRFAEVLRKRGLRVEFQDEAFSSQKANAVLSQLGKKRDRSGPGKATDRLAAALLLQDYLDSHPELQHDH